MLPNSSYNEALFHAACAYLKRGYSVIPIYGDADPERAKVAALVWASYQHRHCTAGDAYHWYVEKQRGGVAIVTGRISSLAVLDFDDRARFDEFQRDYPDLVETYTVETKRGCHLYFCVVPHIEIESQKAAGVDLQFEGRYIVAPPTVIDSHQYRVINDTVPKTVTQDDVQRIYMFLVLTDQKKPSAPSFEASRSKLRDVQMTGGDLAALYQHLTAKMGRNNALFQVSLQARDSGWPHEAVISHLADIHAGQRGNSQHQRESQEQRYREGVRTIASAFSRPARPRLDNFTYNSRQVPNSVREALFHLRQTYTVRVLEGLRVSEVLPGHTFTAAEALEILRGKVGRDSVYQALQAITISGEVIFPRENPPPRTPTLANADAEEHTTHQKKCVSGKGQKSGKRVFHRPARRFIMPGNLELCQKLGVKLSYSDPLTEDDLGSAKQTRQAAHRELIKRRPGIYPRRWLARRLGVSIRTLHQYNQDIPIQVQPMYLSIPITWSTLNKIPADFELGGTFLQCETGKRYPPKQALAARLLAKGHRLVYMRRTANFYSYGDHCRPEKWPPATTRPRLAGDHTSTPVQLPLQANVERLDTCIRASRADNPLLPEPEAPPIVNKLRRVTGPRETHSPPAVPKQSAQPDQLDRKSKRYYRKPLADSRMEHTAQQVHNLTNPNPDENSLGLSLFNARRLVDTYGVVVVTNTLKRLQWMQTRGKIRNPAGFLIVASRIEWRVQHNATGLATAAPRFHGEPKKKRRATF